ncbi:MAG: DUF4838 domain-containing protein, partial [Planctomycetes bacterium]|nr:DUF4838 domain-containing protein [Planctomycetota bacterium]
MSRSLPWPFGGVVLLVLSIAGDIFPNLAFGEGFLVKDGQPQAEIVIADQPARMAKLAASELQAYLVKISGARLPITTAPSKDVPVQVYVGRSAHTDRLKVSDEGLAYGAFRMASGKNWLALLGRDRDFEPREPWGRSHADGERVMKEWDALTGEKWGNAMLSVHRRHSPALGIWEADERGSLNAVYEFLRSLGVRWYYPGELGEIVPRMASIALPQLDKVFRPDFAVRHMLIYFNEFWEARGTNTAAVDNVLWQLRLGLQASQEVLGYSKGHGLMAVHSREEVKKAHPEYYALWGGKRATVHLGNYGAPCLSSQGLFEQNVKFVRAMFDIYHEPMVSVGPADGYTSLCQCDLCKGKGTPERGWSGQLSDYVWGYVNRVAQEVHKTHPNRKVSCIAYGAYQLPPEKIATLSPNVAVIVCRWRSLFYDRETREGFSKLMQAWREKLPSRELYIWDYYLHGRPESRWEGVPAFFPRLIAEDLRSLKGVSGGDYIEVYRNRKADGHKWDAMAINHLNCYVTARLYWDANQDVDALLDEYYEKFYGPARKEMKAFIAYAEANWMKATGDVAVIDRLFELLAAAQKAAGDLSAVPGTAQAGSIYGQRVDLHVQYIDRLKQVRERLTKGRGDNPKARALGRNKADFRLDGKLDDKFWDGLPVYGLKELETGRPPHYGTSFRLAWADDALYLGILCKDRDTKSLRIGAKEHGDTNIWSGDAVEILLETQSHCYYQIAISPAGAVVDLDRKQGLNILWSSRAEVASHIGDDFWSLEVRIPVAGDMAGELDPLNGVAGRKPHTTYPWFFNVCRQRAGDQGKELSA